MKRFLVNLSRLSLLSYIAIILIVIAVIFLSKPYGKVDNHLESSMLQEIIKDASKSKFQKNVTAILKKHIPVGTSLSMAKLELEKSGFKQDTCVDKQIDGSNFTVCHFSIRFEENFVSYKRVKVSLKIDKKSIMDVIAFYEFFA